MPSSRPIIAKLIAIVGAVVALSAAAPTPLRAPRPAPMHDIGRAHVEVTFNGDGTFLVDVLTPPDWLLLQLEPLAPNPDPSMPTGPAVDKRIAELTGTFQQWMWLLFDGNAVESTIDYDPTPINTFDPKLPPFTTMHIHGRVPDGAKTFSLAFGLATDPYPLLITQPSGGYNTTWVSGPVESDHFDIATYKMPSRWGMIARYLRLGFESILPNGVDHALFVLGLVLLTTQLPPVAKQVSAFTVALTIGLVLTTFGVITLPTKVLGAVLALSLAYIAVGNVFSSELKPARLGLVFAFGLVHGMVLAGTLSALGLPVTSRVPGLISFDLGFGVGELVIVAVSIFALGWISKREWYRQRAVVPISIAIAAVGLYLTVARITRG